MTGLKYQGSSKNMKQGIKWIFWNQKLHVKPEV